jgi:nuclear pore complex protein Nup85
MAVDDAPEDSFADSFVDTIYLDPPAFTRTDKAKWKASGRGFLAAASPVGGEIAACTTKVSLKT